MHLSSDQIGVLFWLLACLSATIWGGKPERLVAAAFLLELAYIRVFYRFERGDVVQWAALAGDVFLFAVLLVTFLFHRRLWLLTALGFQIVALLVHVPRLIDRGIHRWAYVAAMNYAGYAVVLALLGGVAAHTLRKSTPDVQQRSK